MARPGRGGRPLFVAFHQRAGGWIRGLTGSHGVRPYSPSVHQFTQVMRTQIRPGEGTGTATVNAQGQATILLGPDALRTWYLSHATIKTTTGALDTSTCQIQVGPASGGIVPGGQSYAGGGDTIGFGGAVLKPGDYVTAVWSGGTTGDVATLTLYGVQDVLM